MNESDSGLSLHDKDVSVNDSKVPLKSLSGLVGFPVEYLKNELLLEEDEVSMSELRSKVISFLEGNFSH